MLLGGGGKKILGLDIGHSSIKAVEFSRSGSRLVLTGCATADVPNEEVAGQVMQNLVKEAGFKTRRVASAISGRSAIVRYISMLRMSDEDLKNAIRFEADKYIPFEIDEVILDCQRLEEVSSESEKEMKVLLVAVKRNVIEDHVRLIESSGLLPTIIDHDSFALGNCFEFWQLSRGEAPTGETIALVDIGATKTSINIMTKGISYFTREIYIAGNDFTDTLAKRLGLDLSEVERLKQDPGEMADEMQQALASILEDLGNEISLSFDFFENQFDSAVDQVHLSGGAAKTRGLVDGLARILEKKVDLWSPTDGLEVDAGQVSPDFLNQHGPQLAVAVGLASRLRED